MARMKGQYLLHPISVQSLIWINFSKINSLTSPNLISNKSTLISLRASNFPDEACTGVQLPMRTVRYDIYVPEFLSAQCLARMVRLQAITIGTLPFPTSSLTMLTFNSWDVLSPKNAANGLGVVHTAELQSIWGTSNAPDNASIPTIQAYWTSFIRTKDPNTYKLKSSPEWTTFNSTGMGRLHFPNDPTNVKMESVPADQRARCAFFQSIGPSAQQ